MKHSRILILAALLICTFTFTLPPAAGAGDTVDNSIWADLLSRHVREGVVDYKGFKAEEERLSAYLKMLEGVDPEALSSKEQMAFYINLYNAWTIKLILGGYPGVESIKDLGSLFKSPWKKEIVRVKGDVITLDDVEHAILRPRFKDARVHFAVNCASKGCPPLLSEPFAGSTLDRQLDGAATRFLNDPKRTYLSGDTLHVSKIFKWFKEDFDGGDIVGYVRRFAAGDLKARLAAEKGSVEVDFLDYDWSLNGS